MLQASNMLYEANPKSKGKLYRKYMKTVLLRWCSFIAQESTKVGDMNEIIFVKQRPHVDSPEGALLSI